jgi:hypothetical protein
MTLTEEDTIYIDCNPVDILGDVVTSPTDNIQQPVPGAGQAFTEATNLLSEGKLYENIGFHTVLGICLLAILYGTGIYVFKDYPKSIIDNKMSNL